MRISLLAFLFALNLSAEVVSIRVDWNNVQCLPSCVALLETNFRKIKEVSEVSVSAADGVATLKWKADAPFSYQPIQSAFARVGIGMNTLQVTVRGTLSHNQDRFFITSIGDNSRFHLLGTIHPRGNNFEPTNSPFNRPLTKEQRAEFLEFEKNKTVVTISGPILNVNQFPPFDLITERVTVSK